MSEKWCIYCRKYDLDDIHSRGYRCQKHGRPMAIDENCPSFSDGLRSDSTIDKAISRLKQYGYTGKPDSSYWYVTSAFCKIMKMPDDNEYMQSFKKMKDYLLTNEEGIKFLKNYDIYGVFISKLLLDNYEKNPLLTRTFVEDELVPQFDLFNMVVNTGELDIAFIYYKSILDFIEMHYNYHPYVKAEYSVGDEDVLISHNNDGIDSKRLVRT